MSIELSFDRGECQGQAKRSVSKPRPQAGGKPQEPSYYLEISTPGGVKKMKVTAEDQMTFGDGDVVYAKYETKSFTDDKTGAVKEYCSLVSFEVILPAAAIAAMMEKAAAKRAEVNSRKAG